MAGKYDGEVTSIDLPCPMLLEVATSIAVEENRRGRIRIEATYASGIKVEFNVALFEKYLGDEGLSDVPIIKYSAKSYAPALCNSLRLRTPNYYRTLETPSPGLVDPLEGCRISHEWSEGSELVMTSSEDGTSIVLDAGGANRTDGCFKTFTYCSSLYQENHAFTRDNVRAIFDEDYTHGSVFPSSRQLARYIVRSFATALSQKMLENAEPSGDNSFWANACAWIVYGPVQYLPDTGPVLATVGSLFSKAEVEIYRNQREYRFWVGFSNTPVQSDEATISLPLPDNFATLVEL